MYIQSLASGSKGNAIYVQFGEFRFFVDVGLSYKNLEILAKNNGIDLSNLTALFITHEHSDHVKGLKVFHKRNKNVPVLLSKGTYSNLKMDTQEVLDFFQFVESGQVIQFSESLSVEVFSLSHDALEPTGYIFNYSGSKVVVLTDTGYVPLDVQEKIRGAKVYVIEFNHDPELLLHSRYPWHIQQRILSNKGHMSNQYAAELLVKLANDETTDVLFAHMSEQNNLEVLVEKSIKESGLSSMIRTHYAMQHEPTRKVYIQVEETK